MLEGKKHKDELASVSKLSGSFSTGGGGYIFEARVQALFVLLMLYGMGTPCLPYHRIVKINLQGKVDGYQTDDLIVFSEDPIYKKQKKLLVQVKSSIKITKTSDSFGKVIQDAWIDFNNPEIFTKNKDKLALFTGPLSAADIKNVIWLLNHAKTTEDAEVFFSHVKKTNFSPTGSQDKLEVIQSHLKTANENKEVSEDNFYSFLKHFYLLDCNFDEKCSVVLPLLHSCIYQFHQQPQGIWETIVDYVQTYNKDSGTITPDIVKNYIKEKFKKRTQKCLINL